MHTTGVESVFVRTEGGHIGFALDEVEKPLGT